MSGITTIDLIKTGENIRKLVKEKNLSPRYIQIICGFTTPQSVYKWFYGKSMPNLDNLVILAGLLDVTIDEILVTHQRKGD